MLLSNLINSLSNLINSLSFCSLCLFMPTLNSHAQTSNRCHKSRQNIRIITTQIMTIILFVSMCVVIIIMIIIRARTVTSSSFALLHIYISQGRYTYWGGVFEQLARYTMRYHESDLHLGLYSSLTSANSLNRPTLLTLFYFSTLLY